jgi:hypothetical protein
MSLEDATEAVQSRYKAGKLGPGKQRNLGSSFRSKVTARMPLMESITQDNVDTSKQVEESLAEFSAALERGFEMAGVVLR